MRDGKASSNFKILCGGKTLSRQLADQLSECGLRFGISTVRLKRHLVDDRKGRAW